MLESLEERRVLAVLVQPFPDLPGGDVGVVTNVPAEVSQHAIASFHGPDGVGKDGPMAKVGTDLTFLFHEYEHHLAHGGTSSNFVPSNSTLQVSNGTVHVQFASQTTSNSSTQTALRQLGMSISTTIDRVITGRLPIRSLDEAALLPGLRLARPSYRPITEAGAINSQGDLALDAQFARQKFDVSGAGITVGVISDSYDSLGTAAADVAACAFDAIDSVTRCDLPAVNVLRDLPPGVGMDEGRAMLQIVHDIAPNARLSFIEVGASNADMAAAIRQMAASGANVIVDDITWPDEPFFQDSLSARAAFGVYQQGIPYFSSAGNRGDRSYESSFNTSTVAGPFGGSTLHDFNAGPGVDVYQSVTVPVGAAVNLTFQWDQPFGSLGSNASLSDLDIFLFGQDSRTIAAAATDGNVGGDALERLIFVNDGSIDVDGIPGPDETFNLAIALASGPVPSIIKYVEYAQAATFLEYPLNASTVQGTHNGPGVFSVAASAYFSTPNFGVDPPLVNDFSSLGGMPVHFDNDGVRLSSPEIRTNPDAAGVDGVNTSFFGTDSDKDVDAFPNFFGTSAAAPHLAAVAALMLEAAGGVGSIAPQQLYDAMTSTAIDIVKYIDPAAIPGPTFSLPTFDIVDGIGYDTRSGHGLVSAYDAINAVRGVPVGSSSVAGSHWHDLNGNGQRDAGEPGLSGWTVYVDANGNGTLDTSEPSAVTSSTGGYRIENLAAGTYTVKLVPQTSWTFTSPTTGQRQVTLGAGQALTGIDFGSQRLVSSVAGVIFDDRDGDGVRDAGEGGLAGTVVFVDTNGDGVVSVLDPQVVTDSTGAYKLSNLGAGALRIQVVPRSGWQATTATIMNVDVVAGTETNNINFGMRPVFAEPDDPDAEPNPGPTGTMSSDATHGFTPGFYLGTGFNEAEGVAGAADGVIFLSGLQAGRSEQLVVIASQVAVSRGYLHGWIDFDDDGTFEPNERVVHAARLNNGTNLVRIDIPAGASGTDLKARFRWAFEKELAPTGASLGGEAEDYVVSIPMDPMVGLFAVDDVVTVAEDSPNTSINVTSNDRVGPLGGTVALVSVGTPSRGGTATVNGNMVVYRPAANFFGTEIVPYTITDGLGNFATGNLLVTVTDVNDAPTATDDAFLVDAGAISKSLDVLLNDLITPDASETLTITNVTVPTQGGTAIIDAATGTILYTPRADFIGQETFRYTVSDGRGGTDQGLVTIDVIQPDPIVRFRLEAVDEAGNLVTQANINSTIYLRGLVEDLRDDPQGVFSAYFDIIYGGTGEVEVAGEVEHNSELFPIRQRPAPGQSDAYQPGLIDEVGALRGTVQGVDPLGGGEFELFRIPFTATEVGTVSFVGDPADVASNDVSVNGISAEIPPVLIEFVNTFVQVVMRDAINDAFVVTEDSSANRLDVLANDIPSGGAPMTITNVTTPSQGGQVNIVGSELRYTPKANFAGVETFNYTMRDAGGTITEATVTVTVTNVNDPPTANNDSEIVSPNSVNNVIDVLDNDTALPDVGETLQITNVTTPSQGGTIRISSDRTTLVYTPPAGFQGQDVVTYTISDGNGGIDTATLTIKVAPVANVRLRITDEAGNPITNAKVGDDFVLSAYVQDLRPEPQGIFAAYIDVVYDGDLATPAGPISRTGSVYTNTLDGSLSQAGLIDEAGGVAEDFDGSVDPLNGNEFLLFSVPFSATEAGFLNFASEGPDNLPKHLILFFGEETGIPDDQISFGTASINIAAFGAQSDNFTVVEDSAGNPLNVLVNDVIEAGQAPVTVISTTTPNQGGTVTINGTSNGLIYTPAPNFTGTELFFYTTRDAQGTESTAAVRVSVTNTNDNPTAVNDELFVLVSSPNNLLDVLANDSSAPDPTETLTVTGVTASAIGATISVAAGGVAVNYTPPAGFEGTDTFTYTISDGNGGTATASVTVRVVPELPNPLVAYPFEFTDVDGNVITEIPVDTPFQLRVYTQDLRDVGLGVFSAYLDVEFSGTAGLRVDGTFADFVFNNAVYPSVHKGTVVADGIDELGAIDGTSALRTGEPVLLVTIPMIADSAGDGIALGNPADIVPPNETVLFGQSVAVDEINMQFDPVTITVTGGDGAAPQAASAYHNDANPYDVNNDGYVSPLDALITINALDLQASQPQAASIGDSAQVLRTTTASPLYFVDVNNDSVVSPLDAILVINALDAAASAPARAAMSSSAVRAPLSAAAGGASVESAVAAVDQVLSELDDEVVDAESQAEPTSALGLASLSTGHTSSLTMVRKNGKSWSGLIGHEDRQQADLSFQGLTEELAEELSNLWRNR